MALDLFINTERPVDRSIVAGINQPQREAPAGAYVAGSSYDVNIYFILNDGTYNAASGDAGTDVQLAISTIGETQSGTFTITDGTDTTDAIAYGSSAQTVEDALNALNSDTGPFADLVDVTKQSDSQYTITFRTVGAQTVLSASSVSLFPESTPTASIAADGDGTTYAQQVLEITRQPAIYQQTWSTITNGHNATVALNTTRLLQSLVLDKGLPFYLEVKLDGETVAREVVSVEHSNMPASAFSGVAIQSLLDAFAADPESNAYFDADAWSAVLSIAAGNGDVTGPASAVDSNFAAFDGTTGKLLKDSGSAAADFATAAQGTLADSALQSADIDTLAELNAIVGDATLIDTTDSRLSDARTPTSHAASHTDGTDDIQLATNLQKGLASAAHITAIEANTAASHDAVTVSDSAEIDLTLTGQDITASLVASSIDETKLDASVNASLDLADSASQPGHTHTASEVTDFDTEVSNNTDVAANTAARHDAVSIAASGGRDYVTISGNQQLTLHDIDLTSEVTGDLPIADGGTGASDAATARTNLGVDAAGTDNSVEVISIACSDETTDLTTGTAKATFRMPFAMTLTEVRASVTTAPTGSTLIVDINEGGATIMTTNKLSIDATEKTSETAATAPGITDSALADDAEITVDIDQIGSTVAGTGLKIYLIGTRA